MVASLATSSLCPLLISSKSSITSHNHVKTNYQTWHKKHNNNIIVSLRVSPQPPKKEAMSWNTLLSNVAKTTTGILFDGDRKWVLPKFVNIIAKPFGAGVIIQHGMAFRQNMKIRSYEIGFDWRVSLTTIMNYLLDTKINHLKSSGISADVFCVTPEMSKNNLTWAVTGTNIVVDHYPSWGDMVQVETWTCGAGRNGVRCDWLFRDSNTGKAIIRVTSFYVMVNKYTRKISKISNEIKKEIEPHLMHSGSPFGEAFDVEDNTDLSNIDENSANFIRIGLSPRWIDLRSNMKVNNTNYLSWILESTPASILTSHELSSMKMKYIRECGPNDVLKSMSAFSDATTGYLKDIGGVKLEHSLRLENGTQAVKARTIWRPKYANNFNSVALVDQSKTSMDEIKVIKH